MFFESKLSISSTHIQTKAATNYLKCIAHHPLFTVFSKSHKGTQFSNFLLLLKYSIICICDNIFKISSIGIKPLKHIT